MKVVVVEIKNKQTAVLCEDGCIYKIKNKNYTSGQIIEIKKRKLTKGIFNIPGK
jgi:hypothetical protein